MQPLFLIEKKQTTHQYHTIKTQITNMKSVKQGGEVHPLVYIWIRSVYTCGSTNLFMISDQGASQ